jgi:hypothetical protein
VKYVPSLLALDYESALTGGTPSHEYYRDDFRAISLAVAWYKDGEVKTAYYEGEDSIAKFLKKAAGIPKVCHNLSFEYGVTKHRFPGYELDFVWDTARLAQLYDNGGNKFQTYEREVPNEFEGLDDDTTTAKFYSGFSLVNSAGRILPGYQDHKAKFYSLIRSRTGADGQVVKPGMEGSNLHLLTPEELKEYATADAVTTLNLYKYITEYFNGIGFDYTLDHSLYVPLARGVADARSRGIAVDRQSLLKALKEVQVEKTAIRDAFLAKYAKEIAQIEASNAERGAAAYKTQKGKDTYLKREDWKFNVGSTAQLQTLFVDLLGIKPTFWTEPGKSHKDKAKRGEEVNFIPKPSFRAAHLSTYGEGGTMLINYKKKGLVETQIKNLLELSDRDGIYHLTLRAVGTATSRMTSGG